MSEEKSGSETEELKPENTSETKASEAAEEELLEDGVPDDADADPMVELLEENADLKDRVLRAMAETENLRKRADREKAEATLYAATNFARDLLSVNDSLAKALEMMPEEAREKADESTRNLIEGIELTRRELLNSFHKHGIVEVSAEGEKFDPNFHQAMFEVPGTDHPSGIVVQVVQSGFKIGERVLRPALVGVSKSGAKDAKKEG